MQHSFLSAPVKCFGQRNKKGLPTPKLNILKNNKLLCGTSSIKKLRGRLLIIINEAGGLINRLLSFQGVSMSTRKIDSKDLHSVSSVCIDAFMGSVAPTLKEEGIKTFQNVASLEGLESRMEADNEMVVYENEGEVVGYIELKEGRHIAMLFVSPSFQKRGVGKLLISKILPYAKSDIITVSASLTSISAYLNFGFECTGEVSESAGLTYQPMQIKLNKSKHADF